MRNSREFMIPTLSLPMFVLLEWTEATKMETSPSRRSRSAISSHFDDTKKDGKHVADGAAQDAVGQELTVSPL